MVSNEIITCPFCGKFFPYSTEFKNSDTMEKKNVGNANKYYFNIDKIIETKYDTHSSPSVYEITITKCPHCKQEMLNVKHGLIFGYDFEEESDSNLNAIIRPKSIYKIFPEYIPKAIREDYIEACSILNLSPKASATLARRALEGMILDFWQIPSKAKGSLKAEIAELQEKIPSEQWKAIDALRNIGNIGAHMEKDVNVIVDIDPGEAEKLIKLIELLIDQWYIAKHEQEQLYNDIVGIDNNKQEERKNASVSPAQV